MNLSNDELRSLLHNAISCYRDHINVYRTANPEEEAVNDVMEAAQQSVQRTGSTCPQCSVDRTTELHKDGCPLAIASR